MGYAHYLLDDGREAGYGVASDCDHGDCVAGIDRGLGYLCGNNPDGWRNVSEPGCGNYYCGRHRDPNAHHCTNPPCESWDPEESDQCVLAKDHTGDHDFGDQNVDTHPFEQTEQLA